MNTRKLTATALLTALAIAIPFVVYFKVVIPPYTATLGSHVPMFLAMLLGPQAAAMVGLGSALGFLLNLGPLVGARAFMHVFVGMAGAWLLKRGMPFPLVAVITAPLHGILEVLVIMPFVEFDAYYLLVVTGVGTVLHHGVDAFISWILISLLKKSRTLDLART